MYGCHVRACLMPMHAGNYEYVPRKVAMRLTMMSMTVQLYVGCLAVPHIYIHAQARVRVHARSCMQLHICMRVFKHVCVRVFSLACIQLCARVRAALAWTHVTNDAC